MGVFSNIKTLLNLVANEAVADVGSEPRSSLPSEDVLTVPSSAADSACRSAMSSLLAMTTASGSAVDAEDAEAVGEDSSTSARAGTASELAFISGKRVSVEPVVVSFSATTEVDPAPTMTKKHIIYALSMTGP